jgi:GNAT superfamily N-acetyltransferase
MDKKLNRIKEKVFNQIEPITTLERMELISFLYDHLDEHGDTEENIGFAIDYALNTNPMAGGFILTISEDEELIAVVVMNKTGMQGYLPENVLVYMAIHRDYRKLGLGTRLMTRAIQLTKGDIALHVEKHNPAVKLYENMGFENLYLEMRYFETDRKKNEVINQENQIN